MRSRSFATVITAAIAGSIGAVGELALPIVPTALAQDFRDHVRADFGLDSMVWLLASFTFPGRRLLAPPVFAVPSLESWTPARGGWAFAHPRELRLEAGKTRLATIPAAGYVKGPVRLFDRGRREELSFRIEPEKFAALARQPEPMLKAGSATVRWDKRRMERVRALVREMTVLDRGSR